MTQVPGSLITVPVKPAMKSKINWLQLFGAASMIGSYFGLPIDATQQAAVVTTIGVAVQILTVITRTFFTRSVVASST